MDVPQAEKDYQLARAGEYSLGNLSAFIITGLIICTIAVILRLWSRKVADIPWRSDDYTLVVALILTIAAQSTQLNWIYNGGLGRHTLTIDARTYEEFGKTQYAWDVLYTVAYPIARISLVLLYRRVFSVQQWFRALCWFLILCYAGYAFGSAVADLCQAIPIEANWDPNVKPKYHINDQKLYIANSGFNIATDAILLVMPLVVIWKLNMTFLHKIGLSCIFSLGVLTVLASIFRLVYYREITPYDPLYTIAKADWWTMVEMDLGLICPCLVTFRPLIASGYLIFASRLSPRARERVDRATGMGSHDVSRRNGTERTKAHSHGDSSSSNRMNDIESRPSSLHSKYSQAEGRTHDMNKVQPPMPKGVVDDKARASQRDENGMAVDQAAALASLDPRNSVQESGKKKMGISAQAVAEEPIEKVPSQGIGVSRDYRLDSEKGSL